MTGELLELSVALGERDPLLTLTLYSSEQTTLADAQSTSWRSSGCAAPEDGPRWFELLDALTPDRGLITAELVASSRR